MNQWSIRRKRIILAIVLTALVVLIGLPLFFFLHRAPTCSDNKMNGDETGVDCGGSCQLLCTPEALPLIMKGDPQILKVATSTYEVVVQVENPNTYGEVARGGYTIKLYDASSTAPIKIIEGQTYVPKASTFAVFEGPFDLGDRVPYRAIFTWHEEAFSWHKNTSAVPGITIGDKSLTNEASSPRLEASATNTSLDSVSNIEFVALMYDGNGNTIAASKTFVESIGAGESVPIVFTWPESFATTTASIDIVPRIFPDASYIR